jgi:hypothetical protein
VECRKVEYIKLKQVIQVAFLLFVAVSVVYFVAHEMSHSVAVAAAERGAQASPHSGGSLAEGPTEVLMWLLLADLNLHGGERRVGSTAVLQATCLDATIIPHLERRLNFSLSCYGCREGRDLMPGEGTGIPRRVAGAAARHTQNVAWKSHSPLPAKLAHACLADSQPEMG